LLSFQLAAIALNGLHLNNFVIGTLIACSLILSDIVAKKMRKRRRRRRRVTEEVTAANDAT
jgi:hypothetical protein